MKKINLIKWISYFVISAIPLFTACEKNEDDNGSGGEQIFTKAKIISNQSGGSIEGGGSKIEIASGAIPKNGSNTNAEVTFSIEGTPQVDNPLPSGFRQASHNYVIMGPEAFNFALPLTLYFPIGDREPSEVCVAKYDDLEGKWLIQPTCTYTEHPRRIGISGMNLGTYVLIENPLLGTNSRAGKHVYSDRGAGGVLLDKVDFSGYPDKLAFCITLKKVISLKYPEHAGLFYLQPGTVITTTGNASYVKNLGGILPQGEYEVWVSMFTKPWPNEWRTYSKPIRVHITNPVVHHTLPQAQNYPSIQDDVFKQVGWQVIRMSELGSPFSWPKGKPNEIPTETETAGTGKFQATLTWTNSYASATDLDLHLYGPNGLHVFYHTPKPTNAAFNLDRDWRRNSGNAIENIYSVKNDWPKGEYKITVDHFSGTSPKQFNVRILNQGTVKTYRKTITTEQESTITTFVVK